jgi:hypothetical protein
LENLNNIIGALKKRNIPAEIFNTKEELKLHLLEEINKDEKVAIGGSISVEELGLYDELINRGQNVLWHWKVAPEKRVELLKEAIFSDIYLCSTNAITEDGKLINTDGTGNRVASMFFGPKKVRIIIGKNKIAKDYDSAMSRIKEVACHKNAIRLGRKTPCASAPKCLDCKSAERMCTVTTIIEAKPPMVDFKVYLVNDNLGY